MKFYYFLLMILAFCSDDIFACCLSEYESIRVESHQQKKDEIIEKALKLGLPTTDRISSEGAKAFSEQATKKVHEGQYEEAIKLIAEGLRKFPKNFILQSDLAALLGDCSEVTPEPLKNRMIQKAKQLFDRLINEVADQPKNIAYDFKNEYFFRFRMYREQYENGLHRVSEYWGTKEWGSEGVQGYYNQGVGAARYAKELIEEDNKTLALDYAQKAIVAWAQYFSYKNDYYNAYVHYALALGILGYRDEMMKALERSASIIKRGLDYFEFKEVIDFIAKIGLSKNLTY